MYVRDNTQCETCRAMAESHLADVASDYGTPDRIPTDAEVDSAVYMLKGTHETDYHGYEG